MRNPSLVLLSCSQLVYMYLDLEMGVPEISKEVKQSCSYLYRRLKEFDIPTRNTKEACNTVRYKEKHSVIMKGNTNGRGGKGGHKRKHTPEEIKRMSQCHLLRYTNPLEREKTRLAVNKKWKDPTFIKMMKEKYNNPTRSFNLSKSSRLRWANMNEVEKDSFLKKQRANWHSRPTKPEAQVQALLDLIGDKGWEYVGNWKVVIGGKNPDFINTNNGKKQIIEVFGDYFHGEEKTGMTKEKVAKLRIDHFAKYGFDTLIIWQCELKRQCEVLDKIIEFAYCKEGYYQAKLLPIC